MLWAEWLATEVLAPVSHHLWVFAKPGSGLSQDFARRDPRPFLAQHRDGAVLDKVHRAPDLLSCLTGSANFSLLHSLGQSLAGRTAFRELLPLALEEIGQRT